MLQNEIPNASPPGVLIVEDEPIIAMDLEQTLTELGYDPFAVAASADEALDHASARRPDIVLMDIRIRGERDGIETAALLRDRFAVPVVYLTAHADEAMLSRAKRTNPHAYLLKPVRPAELRVVLDVSLHRHALERRLRERERWFATTLRSMAEGVLAVDAEGLVTFMNPAAESMTDSSLAASQGRPADEVLQLVGGAHASPLHRVLATRAPLVLEEATWERQPGELRALRISAAPVLDDQALVGAVMLFRDVTEQYALQRRLEAADRLISLGTMAAGVAHEVNNPLAALMLQVTLAQEATQDALEELARSQRGSPSTSDALRLAAEAHEEIVSTVDRLARIVSDLTAFARRQPEDATRRADVAAAVDWAMRTTRSQLRGLHVVAELERVPPVALDETKLGQVLLNLLLNAGQAFRGQPHGEIRVSARQVSPASVSIEVRDNGCGMSEELLSRIFEPFFTTKPVGVGTGLGLSIVYGIVTAVGGEVRVSSQVGEGTTFTLDLPVVSPDEARDRADLAPEELVATDERSDINVGESDGDPSTVSHSRRLRVLVLDADQALTHALTRMLEDHEVVCVHTVTGLFDALERDDGFDVVLADARTMLTDGPDTFDTFTARWPRLAPCLVLLTTGVFEGQVAELVGRTAHPPLHKPFDAQRLQAVIETFALRSGASAA